jgi:hypothetical protein
VSKFLDYVGQAAPTCGDFVARVCSEVLGFRVVNPAADPAVMLAAQTGGAMPAYWERVGPGAEQPGDVVVLRGQQDHHLGVVAEAGYLMDCPMGGRARLTQLRRVPRDRILGIWRPRPSGVAAGSVVT